MAFDPGAELGPRLRQVREQRGLSARELARRIQCSPSMISQIERGLSAPSVGMLYALARFLDLPPAVWSGTRPRHRPPPQLPTRPPHREPGQPRNAQARPG